MRQLLDYQQEVRDPQEFIQNLKVELYPGGGLHLHAEGAGQGVSARRDADRLRVLDSHRRRATSASARASTARWCRCAPRLKNGDIVEIVTQAGHKPSRDWLNFVVTVARALQDQAPDPPRGARARDRARPQGVREGAAPLRPARSRAIIETEAFAKALADVGAKTPDDLFALIGYGTLSAKQLLGEARARRAPAREAAGRAR